MTRPIRLNKERSILIRTGDAATAVVTRTDSLVQTVLDKIDIQPNRTLKIGPYSDTRTYNVEENGGVTYEEQEEYLLYNYSSTGIRSGGGLELGTGADEFNVAAGSGVIVDNYSNPDSPTTIQITWPDLEDITAEFISSSFTSIVGIDAGGNVQQFSGPISATDKRDFIILGVLVHTGPTALDSVGPFSTPAYDVGNIIGDLANSIGYINIEGNIYGADTLLTLAKTAGSSFVIGGNFQESSKSPNIVTNDALSQPFLFKPYRDGSGGFKVDFPLDQDIDPLMWDDGSGTLATVPNNTRWQIQRIYSGTTNDDVIVAYGQNLYSTQIGALNAINVESHEKNPVLRDALLRGFLVIRNSCTDLADTATAVFVAADRFGQVAAEGAQLVIPNGIATVTSAAKTGAFTVNMNKAYQIDNSSNSVTGTLSAAESDKIGQVCECWIQDDASTHNVIFNAPTEDDVINGVAGGGGLKAQAVVSSANSNYKKISVTIIDENEYLIDGVDSVTAV